MRRGGTSPPIVAERDRKVALRPPLGAQPTLQESAPSTAQTPGLAGAHTAPWSSTSSGPALDAEGYVPVVTGDPEALACFSRSGTRSTGFGYDASG